MLYIKIGVFQTCYGRHAAGGRVALTGGGYPQACCALGSFNFYHAGSCSYPHSALKADSSRRTLIFMHDIYAKLKEIFGEARFRKVSKYYEALQISFHLELQ